MLTRKPTAHAEEMSTLKMPPGCESVPTRLLPPPVKVGAKGGERAGRFLLSSRNRPLDIRSWGFRCATNAPSDHPGDMQFITEPVHRSCHHHPHDHPNRSAVRRLTSCCGTLLPVLAPTWLPLAWSTNMAPAQALVPTVGSPHINGNGRARDLRRNTLLLN